MTKSVKEKIRDFLVSLWGNKFASQIQLEYLKRDGHFRRYAKQRVRDRNLELAYAMDDLKSKANAVATGWYIYHPSLMDEPIFVGSSFERVKDTIFRLLSVTMSYTFSYQVFCFNQGTELCLGEEKHIVVLSVLDCFKGEYVLNEIAYSLLIDRKGEIQAGSNISHSLVKVADTRELPNNQRSQHNKGRLID